MRGKGLSRVRVHVSVRVAARGRVLGRVLVASLPSGRSPYARTDGRTRAHARALQNAPTQRVHVWNPGHAVFYVYDTYGAPIPPPPRRFD